MESTPLLYAKSSGNPPAPRLEAALAQLVPEVLARQDAMLAIKDAATGRYLYVNTAMAGFLGRPADDCLGRVDTELLEPALLSVMRAAEQTALAQGGVFTTDHGFERGGLRREYSVLRMLHGPDAQGRSLLGSVWFDQSAQRQRDAQQRVALVQLEELQRANESLRRELAGQGLRDGATGLFTRGHFDDQLRREVDLSTREHREFAVVYIELDPFSESVVALGAQAQARIFDAMGRLLRGNTRAMDASCRIDDRRFAVLLSGVGLATAHARMEGLRRQCAAQIVVLDGQEMGFTVSMGVASFPHTANLQEDLLSACEGALAEAKRRGGNHLTLASIRFEPG